MANGNGKSKSKKKIIVFSVIGVVIVAAVLLIIMGSNKETIVTIQTEPIAERTITQIVSATGKIQPETQVKINAEVSGEIVDLPVREGDRVRRGDLLVKIKPDAYQAQHERALASLRINQANLSKSEAEFKRVSELFSKDLVSQAEMDIAKASYESAKASFEQSQASVRESRETLDKTTIYSPMAGVVSQLNMELGQRVSGSTFTLGTDIMTVADLSRMEARVDVGENDIVMVSLNDTARIEIDAFPDREFIGLVSQIANTAKTTGLGSQDQVTEFEVRILVKTPEGTLLRPGMSMTADIETETRTGVLAVPIQSVTVRGKKVEEAEQHEEVGEGEAQFVESSSARRSDDEVEEVVFVVDEGKVKTVKVKRGISDDEYVEVSGEGLGGVEVVSGPFRAINRELQDGTKVKVDNKRRRTTGASVSTPS